VKRIKNKIKGEKRVEIGAAGSLAYYPFEKLHLIVI
jgi:hypothetical protein